MPELVTVHLFAAARAAAQQSEIQVEPGSLSAVLHQLEVIAPGLAAVLPRCSFLVDGVSAHVSDTTVLLAPGARLDVLPPFAGG